MSKEEEILCQKKKRFWTYIKRQRNSNTGVSSLKDQGQLVTEPESKAELLNQQFNSAFSTGVEYNEEEFIKKCQMPPRENPTTMPPINITCQGVENLLTKLDPSKATGPDGISPKILKTLAKETAPILTTIFKHSLQTGCVPTEWKKANVTPVYKRGEHYKASN